MTFLSLSFLLGKMGTTKPNLLTLSYCKAFYIITRPRWFRVQTQESDVETDFEASCWTALSFNFLIKMETSPQRNVAQDSPGA